MTSIISGRLGEIVVFSTFVCSRVECSNLETAPSTIVLPRVCLFVRSGAHVSKVETLSLARAKSIAEVGFSFLSLVVAGLIGGQRENISRWVLMSLGGIE